MNLKIKYEKGFIKPDKNSLILLGIVLLLAISTGYILIYYLKKEPEIRKLEVIQEQGISEEILEKFRAPSEENMEIPEENLEQFRANNDEEEIPEDVLKQFRAP